MARGLQKDLKRSSCSATARSRRQASKCTTSIGPNTCLILAFGYGRVQYSEAALAPDPSVALQCLVHCPIHYVMRAMVQVRDFYIICYQKSCDGFGDGLSEL